jgi:hypothetical protein
MVDRFFQYLLSLAAAANNRSLSIPNTPWEFVHLKSQDVAFLGRLCVHPDKHVDVLPSARQILLHLHDLAGQLISLLQARI